MKPETNRRRIAAIEELLTRLDFTTFDWVEGFDDDGCFVILVRAYRGEEVTTFGLRHEARSKNPSTPLPLEVVRGLVLYSLMTSVLLRVAPVVRARADLATEARPEYTAEDIEEIERSEMEAG